MSKPELGTKRLCAGCAAKFYDLMRDPIVCPKCETVFIVPPPEPVRQKRNYNMKPVAPKPEVVVEEPVAAKAESEDDVLDPTDDDDKDAEGGVALLEDDEEER